jgi:hypothetical protein
MEVMVWRVGAYGQRQFFLRELVLLAQLFYFCIQSRPPQTYNA